MKKIEDVSEFKQIQLNILEVVDRFCREHAINYSLGCGSMLGAIRHKGYIPWDDDIDIYLLREEYNKLMELFPSELNHIMITSLERNRIWDRPYAKAYHCQTLLKDGGNSIRIGIGIDVYPIDRVPEDEQEWMIYDRKRRIFQRVFELKNSMVFRKGRPLWKYFFLPFTKILLLPVSRRTIAKYLDKYAQRYNHTKSPYVFECCQGIIQKNRFKRSTLEKVQNTDFEGRIVKGMVDYDDYLCNAYGNWRELPPPEKRVSHHVYKAWWL